MSKTLSSDDVNMPALLPMLMLVLAVLPTLVPASATEPVAPGLLWLPSRKLRTVGLVDA